MRDYCTEACKYGDQPYPVAVPLKKIIILINPSANQRSAKKKFEEFCEPIFHLAGLAVEIVKTDSEGHARRYIEELEKLPEAILIAGGDGTLSEAVTGLLRRENHECPIGILPVGRTNSVARRLFFNSLLIGSNLDEVRGLANAAISVVRGKVEKKDVMKIEVLPDEGDVPGKPVYAMASLHWGAYRDALLLRDRYWYAGPFREYASFLFNGFSSKLTWNCNAKIRFTPPCDGCSNCFRKEEVKPIENRRWMAKFIPTSLPDRPIGPDYSKVVNNHCSDETEWEINPTDFLLTSNNIDRPVDGENSTKLTIKLGKNEVSGFDFMSESWSRLNGAEFKSVNEISCRTIEIRPKKVFIEGQNEIYFSIDNEAYEVKPIRISLLPKAVTMYTL